MDGLDDAPGAEQHPVGRHARTFLAIAIVVASAGTGFLASRIWPLSSFSGSAIVVTSESQISSGSAQSASKTSASLLSLQEVNVAATGPSIPGKPLDGPSPLVPAVLTTVPQEPTPLSAVALNPNAAERLPESAPTQATAGKDSETPGQAEQAETGQRKVPASPSDRVHKSAKGADLATVQYWMGHKKKETTFRYIHLVKTRNPDLMEATSL